MKKSAFLAGFLSLFVAAGSIYAQDNAAEKLDAGRIALFTGDYNTARGLFEPFLDSDSLAVREKAAGYFDTYLFEGKYDEWLEEIENRLEDRPDDPYLLNRKGNFLEKKGRIAEAELAYNNSRTKKYDYWKNTLDLALLLNEFGRDYEARVLFRTILRQYQQGEFRDAERLHIAAVAAAESEEFHDANEAFRTAYRLEPQNVVVLRDWAELFLEKFNNADAQQTFEEAIGINDNWADLYAGYARSRESFQAKHDIARKALSINPNHVDAMNVLAEVHILDSMYGEAEEMLQKAVGIEPTSFRTLGNLASVYHFREDSLNFARLEQQALEVNPYCGEFYHALAENCAIRFRYNDAVRFGRSAAMRQRNNYRAYTTLGANLLRIGEVSEAKRYLDYAFSRDPFDIFAKNMLDLIDEYENFEVIESEHFRLKIHKAESGVLGAMMLEVAEEAYDSLSVRYPYRPADKILLEAYQDHQDFAVRVSGIPNLDLLGVCFGDVVALDTPRAQEEREYNWARTLWHELAHVMALGISDHRVPRWFTEGLSVYEEKRGRPEWAREMDIELFGAYAADKLLPIEEINGAFTRPQFPGQVMLAYYQSSKIVEFIVDEYGWQSVVGLLQAFSERRGLEQSLQTVLSVSAAELSERFFERLDAEKSRFDDILADHGSVFSGDDEEEEESIAGRMMSVSDSKFFSTLKEANEALGSEEYGRAEEGFLEALNMYPYYIDTGNPYVGLARIYSHREEKRKWVDILERYVRISEHAEYELNFLAKYYAELGRLEETSYYFNRYFQLNPYDIAAHAQLADIFKGHRKYGNEIRHREIIVALDPLDKPKAYYNLAFGLYNSDDPDRAKRAVIKALEIAPNYPEAQKLLLDIVDRKDRR